MPAIFLILALLIAAINGDDVMDSLDYAKTNLTILKVEVGESNGKFTLWTNASGTQFLVITNAVKEGDNVFPLMHDMYSITPGRKNLCATLSSFQEEPGFIFPTVIKLLGLSTLQCPTSLGNYPIQRSGIYYLAAGMKPSCRGEMGKIYFISFLSTRVSTLLMVKIKISKLYENDPCNDVDD